MIISKTYVTFGQVHRHKINNQVIDKDCVAIIEADTEALARHIAFNLFTNKFCFTYFEDDWDEAKLSYFPRGYIQVN